MTTFPSPRRWIYFFDQSTFHASADARLFKNPFQGSDPVDESLGPFDKLQYSILPGEQCLYKQKPVAQGFTAYIGYDETSQGIRSLKSNVETMTPFSTQSYFEVYTQFCYQKISERNKMLPNPEPELSLEKIFYQQHLHKEERFLKLSNKFFNDFCDKKEQFVKARIKEYVFAYLEWLKVKLKMLQSGKALSSTDLATKTFAMSESELYTLINEIILTNASTISQSPQHQPLIRGIRNLAKFLNVGINKAQTLKNEGVIPYFQDRGTLIFDPGKVLEAISNVNSKNEF